jgi:hypothetical protein
LRTGSTDKLKIAAFLGSLNVIVETSHNSNLRRGNISSLHGVTFAAAAGISGTLVKQFRQPRHLPTLVGHRCASV